MGVASTGRRGGHAREVVGSNTATRRSREGQRALAMAHPREEGRRERNGRQAMGQAKVGRGTG